MSAPENDDLRAQAEALEGEFILKTEAPAEEPAGPHAVSNAEALAALLGVTFKFFTPAWNVSDDECAMLGQAYADVIEKYFPEFNIGPIGTALVVSGIVFGPRLGQPTHPPKPSTEAPTDAEATGPR